MLPPASRARPRSSRASGEGELIAPGAGRAHLLRPLRGRRDDRLHLEHVPEEAAGLREAPARGEVVEPVEENVLLAPEQCRLSEADDLLRVVRPPRETRGRARGDAQPAGGDPGVDDREAVIGVVIALPGGGDRVVAGVDRPHAEVQRAVAAAKDALIALVAFEHARLGGGHLDPGAHRPVELIRRQEGFGQRTAAQEDIAREQGDPELGRLLARDRPGGIGHDLNGRRRRCAGPARLQALLGPALHPTGTLQLAAQRCGLRGVDVDLEPVLRLLDHEAAAHAGQRIRQCAHRCEAHDRVDAAPARAIGRGVALRQADLAAEHLRHRAELETPIGEAVEKPFQEQKEAECARIDDARGLEGGEGGGRAVHGALERLDQAGEAGLPEVGRPVEPAQELVQHGQHRAGHGIGDRPARAIPPGSDRRVQIGGGIRGEEAREEPAGDVPGVPGRGDQQPRDHIRGVGLDPVQRRQADHEVAPRVRVGDRVNVDVVQKVRPRRQPLEAGGERGLHSIERHAGLRAWVTSVGISNCISISGHLTASCSLRPRVQTCPSSGRRISKPSTIL